jgi:hypothetical protein
MPQNYSFLLVSDIVDAAIAEAAGSTTSLLTALQDTQLIERVENLNAEFIRSAHTRHPMGGWSWMHKTTGFQTVTNTTLDGAISAGDATFILTSASDWGNTGRSVIETANNALDFVDHESKSTNTLTVDTTPYEVISIDHLDGARVEKLYPLPSDYAKSRIMYVNRTAYTYVRQDDYPGIGNFTTFGSYILMPRGIGARDVTLYYEKVPSTLTGTTDTTNIPYSFQRWAIEKLKAHIYMVRRKRSDIATSLQLAEAELMSALDYDSQEVSNSESTVLPLPY